MRSPAACGFTLLELMTAIAVVGILLGAGVPAFRETVTANRLTSTANELVTALTVARSEAGKRGIPVTVCAANADLDACEDTSQWNAGWLVFTDDMGTPGVLDDDDELLQMSGPPPSGFTVTADPTTMSYVRFKRSGAPDTSATNRALNLSRPHCSGTKARRVAISSAGRISSGKTPC